MFTQKEAFILKELVTIEIDDVNDLVELSDDMDKKSLLDHKKELEVILRKLNNDKTDI